MTEKQKIKIEKMESPVLKMGNVEIVLGKIEDSWKEPMGPTPKPQLSDLREWDVKLLNRYEPFYSPICDMCCHCAYGKCDLTKGKRGACGIDMRTQQARTIALESVIGAACHGAHARHMLEHQIQRLGRDHKIDMGLNIATEAPITRTIVGIKPQIIGDFEEAMDYAEREIQNVLSSIHAGQEGSYKDFESKAMHVGMIDNLVKEIGDIVQMVGYDFPVGDPEAPLVEIGAGTVDGKKPVILMIGHNVAAGAEVLTYAEAYNKMDDIEIAGICCTAHDLTRVNPKSKIIGPMSEQIRFIRSGIADIIIMDEQCVRTDVLQEAEKVGSLVITTNDKATAGLPNMTLLPADEIAEKLVSGEIPGAMILKPEKVGEVAVKAAEKIAPLREGRKAIPNAKELVLEAKKCTACEACMRACPPNLHISEAVTAAKKGGLTSLAELRELCIGCGRCESACPKDIPIISLMEKASEKKIKEEKFMIRSGRGPILDTEIRNVGPPIVFGEIPGVVAFAGCNNYANGAKDVVEIAEEFLKRRYIVVSSGCAAMALAMYHDEEGKTLYEKYPGNFDSESLANVGSCVANAHILGAAVKIPHIFARRNLRGNFEEIADYIHNRVGAVGVVWGTYSQKALSIGTGLNRWGIPVILGPSGVKYRRLYLGRRDKPEKWELFNAKNGEKLIGDAMPEHLAYVAESKEEAIIAIAKLVMRPNDTTKGRQIKLSHYIDLHNRYYGTMPKDLPQLIRNEADIPLTHKTELKELLKKADWKERPIPDPTLLERMVRKRVD
ncbi:MAG: CO dehydrogenase/acetyl-CoA synthase complex subunit alpha [Candidatus Hydrothermarchaeota archaeon]|nr:CO dehydrogenase/acetyl-CoA synthase complex subunit alpha [Candidatus Hydrothermarchaeota archaeon]